MIHVVVNSDGTKKDKVTGNPFNGHMKDLNIGDQWEESGITVQVTDKKTLDDGTVIMASTQV